MNYDVNVVLTVMADEVARLTLENAILKAKLDALNREHQTVLQEQEQTTEADTAASYDLTNSGGSTP